MATIQVVVDDQLLARLDCELEGASRGRSAFIRQAVHEELKRRETSRLEEQHRRGYENVPVTDEERREMAAWMSIQAFDALPSDYPRE
jgi:metal-responsive CopG/Arc/MetJ family transcriptional regulator